MRVLITGATGYVGGRLVPRLLAAGHDVRCLARDPGRLHDRPWRPRVEVVRGDVLDEPSIDAALAGVEAGTTSCTAWRRPRLPVTRPAGGARLRPRPRAAGVRRIVYLGGLGDPATDLSEHLRSRQETGEALREAGVPVTEFRAAVIVGAGSVSFEMIRYLTERVPIMICPSWVYTRIQPIAIDDVVEYLAAALDVPASAGATVEIGGADVMTYGEMMTGYAHLRGLRRMLVPVQILTPRLSSYWVHLVTPIPSAIARPLIEGLRNEVVVRDTRARALFPDITPIGYEPAVRDALEDLNAGAVETAWTDALASSQGDVPPVVLATHDGMIIEHRQLSVTATPADAFRAFSRLGGQAGWLYMNWAWQLRGLMDR